MDKFKEIRPYALKITKTVTVLVIYFLVWGGIRLRAYVHNISYL